VPELPSSPTPVRDHLRSSLESFLPQGGTQAEKIHAIESGLRSPLGVSMREAMARWVVDEIVPVQRLVPDAYLRWRPPVREAMVFVVARLSPARLAPKLLEQLELPPKTSAEVRLLRLIAKVPGLQKLGQVIARNRHLRPALRNALARLENGIRDVSANEIRNIIIRELGEKIEIFHVRLRPSILSEASVSAVVRFSWRDPKTGVPGKGVFKVLKAHIPQYFAEDMDYLQGLAEYFGNRHHTYGFPPQLIPDTFKKVRRLLQHEVNFAREQKTLLEAEHLYRNFSGVRVPHLIRPLCTPRITAITHEPGIKVTSAAARVSAFQRRQMAEQLIQALVALPLLSSQQDVIFHGDPHAGNLLYDIATQKLVILDWALRERLSLDKRRHLALLFAMVGLRDPVGIYNEIAALSQREMRTGSAKSEVIWKTVTKFVDQLPLAHLPSMVDAMVLLEQIAMKGVRFPASLIMLSKVMFTLDGILRDVAGGESGMNFAIVHHLAQNWLRDRKAYRSPLKTGDWITLQCSALLYTTRLWMRCEKRILDRMFPEHSASKLASA
jgi:ubiquinone biosynthesis protein